MPNLNAKVSLAIQAGGQSSRMGVDKAIKPFLGKPLIQRVIERLGHLGDEAFIVASIPNMYEFLSLRVVQDLFPGNGPLGGLYTALASATFPIVAVVACDMPFANTTLLQAAVELLAQKNADVVVPRTSKGLEPLHAVYRRETCMPVVQSAIEQGHLKVIEWFSKVNTIEQSMDEIAETDPSGLAFWNINTLEEFQQAEEIARERNI